MKAGGEGWGGGGGGGGGDGGGGGEGGGQTVPLVRRKQTLCICLNWTIINIDSGPLTAE